MLKRHPHHLQTERFHRKSGRGVYHQINGLQHNVLVANADILNAGSLIAGQNIDLQAGRNIVNQTLTVTETHQDGISSARYLSLSNQGRIQAGQSLNLQAKQDIVNAGAQISSDGTAELNAGRDIRLTSISSEQQRSMAAGNLKNSQSSTSQHASTLQATGDLQLTAGRDIAITASQLAGQADINLSAGHPHTYR